MLGQELFHDRVTKITVKHLHYPKIIFNKNGLDLLYNQLAEERHRIVDKGFPCEKKVHRSFVRHINKPLGTTVRLITVPLR